MTDFGATLDALSPDTVAGTPGPVDPVAVTETVISTVLHLPGTDELASMSEATFYRHMAATNDVYAALQVAYEDALQAAGDMLTEQIARHIDRTYGPDAATLLVRPAVSICDDSGSHGGAACDGHNPVLVAAAILNVDGNVVAFPDGLSPLHYWMERLTTMMGLEDASLNCATREWRFGDDTAGSGGPTVI